MFTTIKPPCRQASSRREGVGRNKKRQKPSHRAKRPCASNGGNPRFFCPPLPCSRTDSFNGNEIRCKKKRVVQLYDKREMWVDVEYRRVFYLALFSSVFRLEVA